LEQGNYQNSAPEGNVLRSANWVDISTMGGGRRGKRGEDLKGAFVSEIRTGVERKGTRLHRGGEERKRSILAPVRLLRERFMPW